MTGTRCAWCGEAVAPSAPRSRLFATPDSSVRTTSVQAHFHPDCGDELLAAAAEHRADCAVLAWGYGPRAARSAR